MNKRAQREMQAAELTLNHTVTREASIEEKDQIRKPQVVERNSNPSKSTRRWKLQWGQMMVQNKKDQHTKIHI